VAGRFPTVNARPLIRIETLAACLLLLEATAWAEEAVPPATGSRIRSAEIRAAIRAGLPEYQPQAADPEVRMTDSGDVAVERDGVLNLPSVTVQARALPSGAAYDFLTPKGRLDLAMKRHPGLRIGNLFGMNHGIALALLQEEVDAAKRDALKATVENVSQADGPTARELNRLLRDAVARPSTDWLRGRSAR
jgi:hypothetical protein